MAVTENNVASIQDLIAAVLAIKGEIGNNAFLRGNRGLTAGFSRAPTSYVEDWAEIGP